MTLILISALLFVIGSGSTFSYFDYIITKLDWKHCNLKIWNPALGCYSFSFFPLSLNPSPSPPTFRFRAIFPKNRKGALQQGQIAFFRGFPPLKKHKFFDDVSKIWMCENAIGKKISLQNSKKTMFLFCSKNPVWLKSISFYNTDSVLTGATRRWSRIYSYIIIFIFKQKMVCIIFGNIWTEV